MSDNIIVERSQLMTAAPVEVFAKIGDLREWEAWSPWASMDPDMVTTYDGEPGTIGSSSHWVGNRRVGEGQMTVTGLDAPTKMLVDLDFVKPFKANNKVEFIVTPSGDGSNVTWRMSAKNTFMTKVMALFGKSMDKMVGPDFERGLASLKVLTEA